MLVCVNFLTSLTNRLLCSFNILINICHSLLFFKSNIVQFFLLLTVDSSGCIIGSLVVSKQVPLFCMFLYSSGELIIVAHVYVQVFVHPSVHLVLYISVDVVVHVSVPVLVHLSVPVVRYISVHVVVHLSVHVIL